MLKVADLPIVSLATFESKRMAHEKATKEKEKQATVRAHTSSFYCVSFVELGFFSLKAILYNTFFPGKIHYILFRVWQELQDREGLREPHPVQEAPRDDSQV